MLQNMINIYRSKQLIKDANAILITAGAGIGVDSGLPDYRGEEGLWKAYPPLKKLGLSLSEISNQPFEENPSFSWAFYGHRYYLYKDTKPHDGFKMLLELVKQKNNNYFVFTSNIDGQFQKAGFDENKICEAHGAIHYLQCSNNCTGIWQEDIKVKVDLEKFEAKNYPYCPKCGVVARPNMKGYWDIAWNSSRTDEQMKRYQNWLESNKNEKIVIIEIGAGTATPVIRSEGESLALENKNRKLIRINPRDYQLNKHLGVSLSLGGLKGIKSII